MIGSKRRLNINSRLKAVLPLLFTAIIILIAGCKSEQFDSHWANSHIKIDGDFSDWENIPARYFEEQDVLMAMANDDDNLYLAFRFRDRKWLMAIRMTGLTIWLNAEGKKKETFGIRYSGGPRPKLREGQGFDPDKMRTDMMPTEWRRDMEERMADTLGQFAILNSDWWYKEQSISIDGSNGPKAKYGFADDMYTYEFSIPFHATEDSYYGLDVKPGTKIAVGLVWGDMGMDEFRRGTRPGVGVSMPGIGGGPPNGGMDMPPGGGMGGGRPGGMGRRGGMDLPEEQKVWFNAKLATSEANTE